MRPTPRKRLPAQPGFKNINTTIGKIQRPGPGNDYSSETGFSLLQDTELLLGEAVANSLTWQGTAYGIRSNGNQAVLLVPGFSTLKAEMEPSQ